ncbi:MAG: alpha/beta hydrolase [Armatimonadaceae bacterium]
MICTNHRQVTRLLALLAIAVGILGAAVVAMSPPTAAAPVSAANSQPGRNQVTFISAGEKLVGDLYLPENYQSGQRLPAVVIVGPWLNIKEQVAANYARRLAAKGFATLAFDFRHWGESGGEPREYESPKDKVADIRSALAFLKDRPEIDSERIGILGVCFGVGYVAEASDDPLVKSVATVAAWVHNRASVEKMFGKEEVERRLRVGSEAKTAYARDKSVIYVPAYSDTNREAAMFFPGDGFYYNTKAGRGAIPQWTNRYAVLGWEEWINYDGVANGAKVSKPLLCVHSDNSALPENLRRFYALASGPKELVWLEGEHTQFYDTTPYIDRAADAVASHFTRTLKAESRNK